MSEFYFDRVVSRDGTFSAKWQKSSIIPLSVADMDLPSADFLTTKLAVANEKGMYGYTLLSEDWQQISSDWFLRHYSWKVPLEHIIFCPRVIQAVALYIQNFTQAGDRITCLSPSYHPISHTVVVNHRHLQESALIYNDGCYEIDFADLEHKFKNSICFILLSPHNPTGTVWSPDTLTRIAQLAEKYNVFIISDDVHADFIFNSRKYYVISEYSDYVRQNSFICTSPAKTFNIAGLEIANIVIANEQHRARFLAAMNAAGIHNPGYFSVPAFRAVCLHGDAWLSALKNYLAENRRWVIEFCQRHFPQWSVTRSDGTYMLWINYQRMNITEEALRGWFIEQAGVEMSWGSGFGHEGEGFFRVNIAAPRALLEQAFQQLYRTSPCRQGTSL